ncbi:hypothetical protein ACFQZC_00140 [Streptacidiphilus monticola]
MLAHLDRDEASARMLAHGPTGRGLSSRATLLRQARSAWEPIGALAMRRRVQLAPAAGTQGAVYQGMVSQRG